LPDGPLWCQVPVNSQAEDYYGRTITVLPGGLRGGSYENRPWTIRTTNGSARAQR